MGSMAQTVIRVGRVPNRRKAVLGSGPWDVHPGQVLELMMSLADTLRKQQAMHETLSRTGFRQSASVDRKSMLCCDPSRRSHCTLLSPVWPIHLARWNLVQW